MSIIDDKAVLVIGAGTSLQYGIPDGNNMFDLIFKQINSELDYVSHEKLHMNGMRVLSGQELDSVFTGGRYPKTYFEVVPIILAFLVHKGKTFKAPQGHIGQQADEIVRRVLDDANSLSLRLTNQTSETIDDFIFQNPDLSEITKIAVATIIFQRLYSEDETNGGYALKRLDSRRLVNGEAAFPDDEGSERNWVHLFINLVREGVRTEKVTKDNKVKVISFNYDMILEHILDKQFSNTSAVIFSGDSDWYSYIEITHVHGKFEEMVEYTDEPYYYHVLNWANSIAVIHETHIPSVVEKERTAAQEVMANSNAVYATGFSFSQSNVEMLGIIEPDPRRGRISISYSNYDDDYGLSMAMKNYESDERIIRQNNSSYYHSVKTFEAPGTDKKFMSTVNWFYSGAAGRLPS